MNLLFLSILFYLPLLGCLLYNENNEYNYIKLYTKISSTLIYISYIYIYKLIKSNEIIAMLITPNEFTEPTTESYKLITYIFSTLHAIFISIIATLYIYKIIGEYELMQSFIISMSYYLSDCVIIINSSKQISIHDYCIIWHHIIVIYYEIFIFIQNKDLIETSAYYLSRLFIAEYSVIPLNYSWYLFHTNQNKSYKIILSCVLTLIIYFFTRIVNFTIIFYEIFHDNNIIIAYFGFPLLLLNYFWFYKLLNKTRYIAKKEK